MLLKASARRDRTHAKAKQCTPNTAGTALATPLHLATPTHTFSHADKKVCNNRMPFGIHTVLTKHCPMPTLHGLPHKTTTKATFHRKPFTKRVKRSVLEDWDRASAATFSRKRCQRSLWPEVVTAWLTGADSAASRTFWRDWKLRQS